MFFTLTLIYIFINVRFTFPTDDRCSVVQFFYFIHKEDSLRRRLLG